MSSAAGLIGLPWHAAYSASKFGLRGVRRDRYLVYTSRDVQAAFVLQRLFPSGYAPLMHGLNFAMRRALPAAG